MVVSLVAWLAHEVSSYNITLALPDVHEGSIWIATLPTFCVTRQILLARWIEGLMTLGSLHTSSRKIANCPGAAKERGKREKAKSRSMMDSDIVEENRKPEENEGVGSSRSRRFWRQPDHGYNKTYMRSHWICEDCLQPCCIKQGFCRSCIAPIACLPIWVKALSCAEQTILQPSLTSNRRSIAMSRQFLKHR